jgi:hypothetical protein
MLKGLDVLVLVKLAASAQEPWTYQSLSRDLELSTSQLHSSIQRCVAARLMDQSHSRRPLRSQLVEFLIHGVKYCFPAEQGQMIRGIPTAYAASPLNRLIVASSEPPPVWPHPEGRVRGTLMSPIHRAAPAAALKDVRLYEMLALLDAVRSGRARERELAARELKGRLGT